MKFYSYSLLSWLLQPLWSQAWSYYKSMTQVTITQTEFRKAQKQYLLHGSLLEGGCFGTICFFVLGLVCLWFCWVSFKSWLLSEKTVNTRVWLYSRFTQNWTEENEGRNIQNTQSVAMNLRKNKSVNLAGQAFKSTTITKLVLETLQHGEFAHGTYMIA